MAVFLFKAQFKVGYGMIKKCINHKDDKTLRLKEKIQPTRKVNRLS